MTNSMTGRMLLRFLDFYRYWISPVIHVLSPSGCKFEPTCSHFASEAIAIHGAGRGGWMALGRLLRCHPFSRGGFDPVPLPEQPEEARGRESQKSLILPDPLP
jgi:putative membrane protein insertion efficiency factor